MENLFQENWQGASHSTFCNFQNNSLASISNLSFISLFGTSDAREDSDFRTTVVLARAFDALGINRRSVVSMSFEELALCIGKKRLYQ
jgi:hypothetical protein